MHRKNMKSTKIQEVEVEISAYKDECQRLRELVEEVMKTGGQGQRVGELEEQVRDKEFTIQRLEREKGELVEVLQERNDILIKKEEKGKGGEEKQKKELSKELTKVKKTVRDREKEISKLRTEISAFRKVDGNIANTKQDNNGLNGGVSTNTANKDNKDNKEQHDVGQ